MLLLQEIVQSGGFAFAGECRKCSGVGHIITNPCTTCRGQGRVEKTKSIKVDIPAGIESDSQIRVPGGGEEGINGGSTGALFVHVLVSIEFL